MMTRISALCAKEIINLKTGTRLGYIGDAEIDTLTGEIKHLIIPGKAKLFGLLGREDDYILPWKCIARMGADIILVEQEPNQPRRKREKRKIF